MVGLDINWFRAQKGYDPNVIRKSLQKRYRDPHIVDNIIEMDTRWRKMRYQVDTLKMQWNNIGKVIRDKKKANKEDPCEVQIISKNQNQLKQQEITIQEEDLLKQINLLINSIGNLVHESVPVSNDEKDNLVIRTWGKISQIKITGNRGGLNHHKVLQELNGYDPERGQKIAGHRGYFLKGVGVLLNNALINYGLNFLNKRKYQLIQPPYFMKKQVMAQTCQLSDFDDQLYKVEGSGQDNNQFYLIATSEQPISAMHRKQWIEQNILPIRYAGNSSCFRKEAGAAGKDNWGIFRVHQFEKIEQFVITKPQQSWAALEDMITHSQEFYQSLGLPYRVISIVSGALNDAAAKKYDLEAWFPGYADYRELVSCSNCTDFQSRTLNIRCGGKKKDDTEKRFVHMLNGTLCATERTLCCILENYQTQQGLNIPIVLQPFMGCEFIPFRAEQKEIQKEQGKKTKKNSVKQQQKQKEQKNKNKETMREQKQEKQEKQKKQEKQEKQEKQKKQEK